MRIQRRLLQPRPRKFGLSRKLWASSQLTQPFLTAGRKTARVNAATTAPTAQKARPDGAGDGRPTGDRADSGEQVGVIEGRGASVVELAYAIFRVICSTPPGNSAPRLREERSFVEGLWRPGWVSFSHHHHISAAPLSRGGTVMNGKILVVDDDPEVRMTTREFLSGKGYAVSVAAGGREALSMLETVNPDVVLLDVIMPDMDGMETLRRLVAAQPSLPVIMITANADIEITSKVLQMGAADYVPKPFDLDYLDQAVNIQLSARSRI